jgi:hypothetical protein
MRFYELFLWLWAISLIASCFLVAMVGAKYYFKDGFKFVIREIKGNELKRLKIAACIFLAGIPFLIIGLLLMP